MLKNLSENNEKILHNVNEKNRKTTDLEIENNKLISINNTNNAERRRMV